MTRHQRSHIDRCFDIDEPTSDTPNSTQQGPLEYCKRVDAHRLAAVSAGGGWWNPTTQELIPILHEDDPNYRQNEVIINVRTRRAVRHRRVRPHGRTGRRRGQAWVQGASTPAAPRLRLCASEPWARHQGAASLSRAQEHPAHGALHRVSSTRFKNFWQE